MRGSEVTLSHSWGGLGVLWNKNVATIYVRPQRYTKEFIDNGDTFSLCILPEQFRQIMNYCGSHSGKIEDKVLATNLTVKEIDNVPVFEESRVVLICKKLYAQEMTEESFVDKALVDAFYKEKDFHVMYVAEIIKVLTV